jgi:hypothetical protein
MHGVKAFSFALREMHFAHGSNAKALFFKTGNNLANVVVFDGVGLDD